MQAIRTDTTNKQTRLHWVIGLFSLLPLAYVTLQAVRAPKLNLLLDYWDVLAKITTDDGSLQPRMLFTYNLEQPFAVPSLLFWADARFFGGDNRVLTVLTVLLMAGIVVLLSRMLPTSLSPVKRAALTVGFAFIMLSTHGIELWVQGTNGISWTPALFFVVLTVFLMHRGRFWPAFAAAVFGCLCFGVGFPAWLGLVLVAWLRREPRWKVLVSAVAGIAVLAIWLTTRPSAPQALATSSFDVQHRLAAISASLGAMWASSESHVATLFAVGVGLLLAILLAVFAVAAVRGRFIPATPEQSDEAGWIGLATCTLALALLIGLGRTTPGINVGMISRYSVSGGLALCSALTLVALRRPRLRARYVLAGVVAVSLVTYATGYPKVATVKTGYYGYGAIEVALRVDAPGALTALQVNPEVVPAARALGMYPLTGSFSLDCHGYELGSQINFGGIKPLPGPHAPGVTKGVLDTPPVRGDALLSGWAVVADTHPDCVLVLDESGKVVGSGITGVSRPDAVRLTGGDANAGWRAVAAPNSTASRIVLVAGGTLYGVDATP